MSKFPFNHCFCYQPICRYGNEKRKGKVNLGKTHFMNGRNILGIFEKSGGLKYEKMRSF